MGSTNRLKTAIISAILVTALFLFPLNLCAEGKDTASQAVSSKSIEDEVIETETGFYYTVKKGDTLWDLSQRFSDSPYLWPDLWSDNSQIANPHLIYPGQRIRLFLRKDIEKKAIETKAPPIEIKPEIEPEAISEIKPEVKTFYFAAIDRVGFVKKKPVTPEGFIFRAKEDKKLISKDDIVYIRQDKSNPLAPGSKYTVFRTFEPIKDKKTGDYIGIQHYLPAVVEITQSAPRFAIARVIQSFSNVKVNDQLMPYVKRSKNIARRKSQEGLLGEIIIAEEHNLLIADNTIAFINKGKKDGVKPGQRYNVFYQKKSRIDPKKRKKFPLDAVIFGELLVLHTEETTSTVFITKTDRNISPGTTICTPPE